MIEFLTIFWTWPGVVVFVLMAVAYRFSTSTFGYWRDRNVPYVRPLVPLFGNLLSMAIGMEHQMQFYGRLYNGFRNCKFGGLFQMRTPYLMVCDPELINRILISDFTAFTDHGMYTSSPSEDPLANGLFNMNGVQWRTMRQKLSPAFTTSKLRHMHGQIKECSERLMRNVADGMASSANADAAGQTIEIRDVLGKYSTDVIGTCAFGLHLDAINDEKSAFRKHGKSVFRPSLRVLLRDLTWMVSPTLRRILRIRDFPPDAVEFFEDAFTSTMRQRQADGLIRNDLMQSLIQARMDLIVNKTKSSGKSQKMHLCRQ